MTSEQVTIYALCDPETEEVRYVGQTGQELEKRLYQHMRDRSASARLRSAWIASLGARGLLPRIVLLEATSRALADEAERRHIAEHKARGNTLLNGTPGASGRHKRPRLEALTWSCVVRLLAEDGLEIEQLARRDHVPLGTVCRRLIVERLDQLGARAASVPTPEPEQESAL